MLGGNQSKIYKNHYEGKKDIENVFLFYFLSADFLKYPLRLKV